METTKLDVLEHKVLPIHGENIVRDFLDGKFTALGIECNCRRLYGSPLQKRITRLFRNVWTSEDKDLNLLGSTDLHQVWPNRGPMFVANMYVVKDVGYGRNPQSGKPVNRFNRKALANSLDSLIKQLRAKGIDPNKNIALQRMCGGLGGVPWSEVCEVLDRVCAEHKISIYVYLPANYDSTYIRGA